MATTQIERIGTLDSVRGVAVMGILLMNIVAFGMPETAYMNPRAYGGAQGLDLAVYLVNYVLFDGKMRGLFSFLFGASMLLVIEPAEAKGKSPAAVHFSRMAWLFVFGIAHYWLFWWGDILNHYAVIGCIAFAFRKSDLKTLVTVGLICVGVEFLFLCMMPLAVFMMEAGQRVADPEKAQQAARSYRELQQGFGIPDRAWIGEQIALHRGSWAGLIAHRGAKLGQTIANNVFIGPETLGYMLLGMAGLKSGLLTGAWQRSRYLKWMAIGLGIGIPAYCALAVMMVANDFSIMATVLGVMTLSTPFRPLMIVGWACLIVLLVRPGGTLTTRIAAAGRMAFTNYLATTIVMTTLFYGYGLGWYGTLSRAELYLPVLAMWIAMLLWSKPWLDRFRFGPLEWLWRSLSRRRPQPMRADAPAGA